MKRINEERIGQIRLWRQGALFAGILVSMFLLGGCGTTQTSATDNNKMQTVTQSTDSATETESTAQTADNSNAITKASSIYDVDFEADRAAYQGNPDIVVGDHYFATQINDWYMNFEDYEGKVVEIEGYYLNQFQPYDFIGRYGPECPYCQGGYVSFEILTDQDLTALPNAEQWIKVTGILRVGEDTLLGKFCYIEALEIELMDQVGLETVTN